MFFVFTGVIFSCNHWKITYRTGIATRPKNVPMRSPAAAPVPMDRFPTEPIPEAKTKGSIPKIKAKEVIRIGLSLAFAALMADMAKVSP